MNKIFRIVWNQATQSWVAVSELTKAHKKQSSSNAQKSAVKFSGNFIKSSAIALTLLSGHSAYAAETAASGLIQINSTGGSATANGSDAIAIGKDSQATGNDGIAVGREAETTSNDAMALGHKAKAKNTNAVAIGKDSKATGATSVALGAGSNATGNDSYAIGWGSNASKEKSISIGNSSAASGDYSVALGAQATATGRESMALGKGSNATKDYSYAIGSGSNASAPKSISIGYNSAASHNNSLALGWNSKALGPSSVALGAGSNALGDDSYAIGYGSKTNTGANFAMAFGNSSKANKANDIAFGKEAETRDQGQGHSIAIGYGAMSGTNNAGKNLNGGDAGGVAIGTGAYTGVNQTDGRSVNSSVAVGAGAGAGFRKLDNNGMPAQNATDVDSNDEVLKKAFGVKNVADYQKIAGGTNGYTNVNINEGTALGRNARAIGDQSVAIGAQTIAGMGAIALGGNDITQFADKKYYKSTKENFAATETEDHNQDAEISKDTISGAYNRLVGTRLDKKYKATYAQDGSVVLGVQAHSSTPLGTALGTNALIRKGAFGATAIGAGSQVQANAEAAVAIGMGSFADGKYAVAAGTAANAKESAVAAGYKAKADKSAVAVGDSSEATTSSVAVGQLAKAEKVADIAVGQGAVASGEQGAIAMGLGTIAKGHSSIMIGGSDISKAASETVNYVEEDHNNITDVTVEETINGEKVKRHYKVVGTTSKSDTLAKAYEALTGKPMDTTSLDYSKVTNGHSSISLGIHALSQGDLGTAIGTGARADSLGSIALGAGAKADRQNAVAIGTGSTTELQGTRQTDVSYNAAGSIVSFDSPDVAYTFKWAGGINTSSGDVVSFGSAGAERQLKNVAAGRVAEDSTDAINGSQLNSVARKVASGWQVAGNGKTKVAGIGSDDQVNFTNGNGTTVSVTVQNEVKETVTENGKQVEKIKTPKGANVKFDVKAADTSLEVGADGVKVKVSDGIETTTDGIKVNTGKGLKIDTADDKKVAVDADDKTITVGTDGKVKAVTGSIETVTDDNKTGTEKAGQVRVADAEKGKLATVDAVASAVNNAAWSITSGTDGGSFATSGHTKTTEKISAGGSVTFKAGDNLIIKQAGTDFTYSLNPILSGLTSAEFKGTGKNAPTTKLTNAGITITSATTGKNPVSLTEKGLNNGGNAITNVAGNLDGAKANTQAPTTNAAAPNTTDKDGDKYINPNNAATVGDVLNAGWNLQGNNAAKDFVTAYDTVNFVDGDGTTVSVENTDNKTSKIKYSVNLGDGLEKDATTNKIKAKTGKGVSVDSDGIKVDTGKGLKIDTADGKKVAVDADDKTITVGTDGKVKAVTGSIEAVTDTKGTGEKAGQVRPVAADAADKGKLATVDAVANAVNSAKWMAKATNTDAEIADNEKTNDGTKAGEGIAAGDEVTFTAGKNLRVKRDGKNFTFATDKDVSFDSVKVGAEDTAANGKKPVNLTTGAATSADNNQTGKAPTTALNISSGTGKDAKPTQITGVGSVLNTTTVTSAPDGIAPATQPKLVNLGTAHNQTALADNVLNSAATVRDLANMGWKISSDKATGADGKAYSDVVRNADEVKFVGKNAAKVSGKTDPTTGIRTITVDVEVPDVKTAELVSSKDGSVIAPSTNSKLQEELKAAKDELAALPKDATDEQKKEAEKKVKDAETALNDNVDKKGVATAKNVADMINTSGFTLKTSATADGKKDAASTGDEVINPGKTVEMVAGKNLTVKQEANGKVTYSLNPELSNLTSAEFKGTGTNAPTTKLTNEGVTITPATGKNPVSLTENGLNNGSNTITNVAGNLDGAKTGTNAPTTSATKPTALTETNAATVGDVLNAGWNLQGNNTAKDFVTAYDTVNFVDGDGTTVSVKNTDKITSTIKYSVNLGDGLEKDATTNKIKVKAADKSLEVTNGGVKVNTGNITASSVPTVADADKDKIATVGNVADAIKAAAWKATSAATTNGENSGKKEQEVKAGDTVTFEADKNIKITQAQGKFTFATKDDVKFNSIQLGGNDGPKLTKDGNNLKVSGSNGTDPVKITNVADGNISADSKDAINGSQFNAVANNNIKLGGDNKSETNGQSLNKAGGMKFNINGANGIETEASGDSVTVKINAETKAKIDSVDDKADKNLSNITADGETKIKNLVTWKAKASNSGSELVEGDKTADSDTDAQQVGADGVLTLDAGKNLLLKRSEKTFTYALSKTLSDLTSAEFKKGDVTTKINGDGLTIQAPTPAGGTAPKAITVNKDGISAGDKAITDVNSGLTNYGGTDAKKDLINLGNSSTGSKVSDNNAATVGDLRNMGWVVSSNKKTDDLIKEYSDTVKNANEVRFVGEGTAIVTGKTEGNVRTITVKVDDQTSTNKSVTPVSYTKKDGTKVYPKEVDNGDGTKSVKFYPNPDGSGTEIPPSEVITSVNGPKGTKTPTTLSNVEGNLDGAKTNTTAPTTSHAGVDTKNPTANNYVNTHNAATVGDVLQAGWNLQNNGTAKDFVKPYDTVNFVNGINTTAVVTTSDDGTTSNVTYNVTGLPVTYTTADGTPVSKIGDKYYKVNDKGQPVDANGKPSTKVNANGQPLDENGVVIQPIDTTTNPLTSKLVNPNVTNTTTEPNKKTTDPTQLGNVTSGLQKYGDTVDGKEVPGSTKANNGLIDLSTPTDGSKPKVSDNTAATVGDLRNMGWIVSSDKTTGETDKAYTDTVKNANEVKFVGAGTAIVSGKTVDGVRTITVKVDDQTSTNNSVTPVNYTKADGTKVYPKMVTNPDTGKEELKFFEKLDGSGAEVPKGDVITSINGPEGTTSPTTLKNVKNNIPNVNDGSKTITTPDGKEKAGDVEKINKAPLKAEEAAALSNPKTKDGQANPKYIGNNAATVSDVLNAGWNLQNNGAAKDFVKPFDTVNFRDGGNTVAVVTTSDDGTTSNVTFNVVGLPVATTVNTEDGPVHLTKVGDNYYPVNGDGTPNIQTNADGNPTNGYVKADDGNYYPAGNVTFTKDPVTGATTITPVTGAKPVTLGNTLTNPNVSNTNAEPNKSVSTPTSLTNVKHNLDQVDDGNEVITKPDGTVVPKKADKANVTHGPISAAEAAKLANPKLENGTTNPDYIGNNAATIGDVLNAGWNLQGNGKAVDFVKPYDTVNFRDGGNTTVSVTTDDNLTSHVQVNVTGLPVTNTITDANGKKIPVVKVGDAFYRTNPDGTPNIERDTAGNPTNGYVRANDGKLYSREDVTVTPAADPTQPPTITPKAGKTPTTVNTNLVNPNVDNTKDNPGNNVNTPNQLGNVANGAKTFTPVAADGTEATDAKPAVKLANDGKWYPADQVEPNGKPKENAIPVANPLAPKNADGDVLEKGNDGKWYKAADLTNGKPNNGATVQQLVAKPANSEKSGLIDFTNSNPNNAATIGDLQNMGWVVSAEGNSYSDQVRNANEVKFVGKNGIQVSGKTDDKGVRTLTFEMEAGEVTSTEITKADGTKLVKVGDKVYKPEDIGTDGQPKQGKDPVGTIANDGKVYNNGDVTNGAPNNGANPIDGITVTRNNGSKFVTGNQVADAIEKSGFIVGKNNKALPVSDFKNEDEKVNPNDELRFADGDNTNVKLATKEVLDASGKVKTVTTVKVDVVDLPVKYTDADGNIVKKGEDGKYYNPKDLEGKVYDPTTKEFKNSDGTALDKQPEAKNNIVSSLVNPNDAKDGKVGTPSTLTNVASGTKTIQPAAGETVKDKDNKELALANNGKWYEKEKVGTDGKPVDGATPLTPVNPDKAGLADLDNSKSTNALSVEDAKKLGWVVGTPDNNYNDQVRNANKVDFKGENGIEVTGKTTADGIREITVGIKEGTVTNNVKVTKEDGTVIEAIRDKDGKLYEKDVNGKVDKTKPVETTNKDKVENNGSGFVTGNTVATAIQESGWNVGLADSSKANEAFNDDSKALSADKLEKVNPDDNVRFADGKNTKVQAVTMDEVNKDGKKITNTYVRFNVDLPISQITSKDKDGNKVAKAADGKWHLVKADGTLDTTKEVEPSNVRTSASMDPDGLGDKYTSTSRKEDLTTIQLAELTGKQEAAAKAAEEKIKDLLKGQSKDVIEAASKAAVDAAKKEAKVQYLKDKGLDKGTGGTVISNVAWGTKPSDAVNVDQLQNSGINVHSRTVEGSTGKVISGNTSPTKVKMDETVNVDAGNNIEITRNGRDIAIATSMTPQFDSVQFGKEGPKITGKAAQPAKPATATSPATPAQPAELSVNGAKITGVAPGQISATSKDAINGSQLHAMGNKLQGQINKLGNRMNAGMATSAAMANLLQPHKPGQSVATAGIGQHKDQAAVAVGYSRVSDNGKYGIRFSMGANTQGEVTSGAAVGYFW
ncbi:ESPR-type extended signal peptide-containing protein [Haemophilus haemolyticus]|uniref:Putative hep/Hag n=1 Tax=Haemophilus haemolyticus M19501 TaxID=1028803 RepID=F9GR46_HAEHA|nr:ESPR-type extended signal peptide-containing protein [Haemophilus haemolyticus]EGT74545.1 putative hep/Hag [Haemophilus haemolyticus M19501]